MASVSNTVAAPMSSAHRLELIIILGTLQGFAPMAVDMYLASLPTLEGVFGATTGEVQRTLAAFFLGFAGGQLVHGPITDRFGRKKPLALSLLLFIAASLGCSLAPTIGWMAVFRFLQALGACGGAVISRAMVRDLFPPAETRKVFSLLMVVNGVAPILAPLLGGYLLVWFGWKSVFYTLALIGAITLLGVSLRLPESLRPGAERPLHAPTILSTYARLLKDPIVLGACLAVGASAAGMFAYIASAPFVFIRLYGVPEQHFGWFFSSIAFGIIIVSNTNARLLHGQPAIKMLRYAAFGQLAGGLLLIASVLNAQGGGFAQSFGIFGVWIPLLIYVSCVGIIYPGGSALAMAGHPEVAGMASALFGTFQFGTAAISTTLLGWIGQGSALPMAIIVSTCAVLAFLINIFMLGRKAALAKV